MTVVLKVRRTYRGVYLVGRRRYIKVKWLRPDVRAVGGGLWQVQVGRLLVRLARKLGPAEPPGGR